MSDIDNLLAKHFDKETSDEEELIVQQFIQEHPDEYNLLKSLWTKKNIQLESFDPEAAWQKISSKPEKTKVIRPFRRLLMVASIAAVFLLAAFAANQIFNLNGPVELQLVNNTDQTKTLHLEDGSVVYLNAKASVSYPEKFSSENRSLRLKGEAFFEIAKDPNRPFVIETKFSEVEVLGTSFNIDATEKLTEVSVKTGKVKVTSVKTKRSKELIPNQSIAISEAEFKAFQTNNNNYLAWKTGEFEFEKTPIDLVVEDLNSFYKNQITLNNKEADCLFTSSFKEMELEEILEVIQLSCNIQITKKNQNYELD